MRRREDGAENKGGGSPGRGRVGMSERHNRHQQGFGSTPGVPSHPPDGTPAHTTELEMKRAAPETS